MMCAFYVLHKKSMLTSKLQRLLSIFFFRNLIVSAFIFKFVIHLELIFVYVVKEWLLKPNYLLKKQHFSNYIAITTMSHMN